jgi:ACS family hexuronate transporter-like MFS transporter
VKPATDASPRRWLALAVFVLSTAINYLDRQTLATLAPAICDEFHLSNQQYGLILSAFSITYAACAPFAGMLIDRIGLNAGVGIAVGMWSIAGIATGFTNGLGGLVACRAALGAAESGGIPAAGKAIHQYLKPAERALGNAVNQAGVSLGAAVAPVFATWLWLRFGWRQAFVATGVLGLLWIPLWLRTAGRARSAVPAPPTPKEPARTLFRDRRLWIFVAANALAMTGYSLWTNWTTKYLVARYHLTLAASAWYAWIPPLAALAGGFAAGALSLAWIRRGLAPAASRYRACLVTAAASLATLAVPWAPSPGWATAGIALGFAAVSGFSVNMYTLPLDVFPGARAAFAVSALVASYGALQAVVSPLFGRTVDLYGYAPLILMAAVAPAAACAVLRMARPAA